MPSPKNLILVGGAFAIGALGAVAGNALVLSDDPTDTIRAVDVGAVATPGPATDAGSTGQNRRVIALEELDGTLSISGDDRDDFAIGGVDLDFGPEVWLLTAGPLGDYDGDGSDEPLVDELEGLVDSEVRLLVRFDDDRDDADVYVINAQDYRDTAGGPPPWEQASGQTADMATTDELLAAATAAVGDGARVTDLDRDEGGWEAEVHDAQGREHRVLLDSDANVLDVRLDD